MESTIIDLLSDRDQFLSTKEGINTLSKKCDSMSGESSQEGFNKDRAELFEVLRNPTRIKILQLLSRSPLSFSDLKVGAEIESNGLLSYHLGKLGGLVTTTEGDYTLTDEGREALKTIFTDEVARKGNDMVQTQLGEAIRWSHYGEQCFLASAILFAFYFIINLLITGISFQPNVPLMANAVFILPWIAASLILAFSTRKTIVEPLKSNRIDGMRGKLIIHGILAIFLGLFIGLIVFFYADEKIKALKSK